MCIRDSIKGLCSLAFQGFFIMVCVAIYAVLVSGIAVAEMCIRDRLRGVRPFFSDKFDITKHKRYKELSDYDKKNAFDMEQ